MAKGKRKRCRHVWVHVARNLERGGNTRWCSRCGTLWHSPGHRKHDYQRPSNERRTDGKA